MLETCALIIANEDSLVRVCGVRSLEWVVTALRQDARIRDCIVVTRDEAVIAVAVELGLRVIAPPESVSVGVKQSVEFDALLSEVARFLTRGPGALQRVRATSASGSIPAGPDSGIQALSAVQALVGRSSVDALLVVSADKALLTGLEVGHLLDAVMRCTTATLVAGPQRTWSRSEAADSWLRSASASFVDLDVAYAVSLAGSAAATMALPVAPEIGWSVGESNQQLAIDAVLRSRVRTSRYGKLPREVAALVMDFDGVFTDNGVIVSQSGEESVRCDRGDGLGLTLLKAAGLPLLVISKERNPVVFARCQKLGIPALTGVDDKLPALKDWAEKHSIKREHLVYIGNDVNDLECLNWAGCGVAVADSHTDVLDIADVVLAQSGGRGALRELADQLLSRIDGVFPVVPRPQH